jgi:hypothetical protein
MRAVSMGVAEGVGRLRHAVTTLSRESWVLITTGGLSVRTQNWKNHQNCMHILSETTRRNLYENTDNEMPTL